MKQKNGITLVALVITIIVLLILAGVAISMITGGDGLFSKARQSAEIYSREAGYEELNMQISVAAMEKYGEGKYENLTLEEIADNLAEYEQTEYLKPGKTIASTEKIDVTGYKSILVKLKAYPFEYEISVENGTISIDGKKVAGTGGAGTGTPITSQITEENVASHIGEYVNLGTDLITKTETIKADWRIFDADSTGVYVILADYLPNTSIPGTMEVSEGGKQVTISKNTNRWTIGWIRSGNGACADNTEVAATLLTASNWNFLAPSSKFNGKITGGPTYEQFVRSWNKVNSSVQKMDVTTPTDYGRLTDSTGVYIITDRKSDIISGYWLASPVIGGPQSEWNVGYAGTVSFNNFDWDEAHGVRPLVHLTSDFNVTGQDAKGVWQLAQ